jgi:hypothetical protein
MANVILLGLIVVAVIVIVIGIKNNKVSHDTPGIGEPFEDHPDIKAQRDSLRKKSE